MFPKKYSNESKSGYIDFIPGGVLSNSIPSLRITGDTLDAESVARK